MTRITEALNRSRRALSISRLAALGVLVFSLGVPMQAATINTWISTGTDLWSHSAHWSAGTTLSATTSYDLYFLVIGSSASTTPSTFDDVSSLAVQGLQIISSFSATVNSGNVLTISTGTTNGTSSFNSTGALINAGGTIYFGTVSAGGTTYSQTGGSLSGTGTFINGTNSTITGGTISVGSTSGTTIFTNNGTLSGVTLGTLDTSISGGTLAGTNTLLTATLSGVTNIGTSTESGDHVAVFANGTNSGTLSVTNGTLSITGTTRNSGTLSASGVGTLTVSGTVNNAGGTINDALFSGASITGGTVSAGNTASGTNTFSGITLASGSTLSVIGGTTTISGVSTNSGNGIYVSGGASLNITGTLNANGGTLSLAGASSSINISGTVDPFGTYDITGGTTSLTGSMDVTSALLAGGTLLDEGTLTMSAATNSATDLVLDSSVSADVGSYDQTSGGTLAVNFTGSLEDGAMVATGTVTLSGNLELLEGGSSELNLGSLSTNSAYDLISADTISGDFGAVDVLGGSVSQVFSSGSNVPSADATGQWYLVFDTHSGANEAILEFNKATGPVPEPATDLLLGGALVGLVLMRKKLIRR